MQSGGPIKKIVGGVRITVGGFTAYVASMDFLHTVQQARKEDARSEELARSRRPPPLSGAPAQVLLFRSCHFLGCHLEQFDNDFFQNTSTLTWLLFRFHCKHFYHFQYLFQVVTVKL